MRVLLLSWEYPPVIEGGLGRHVRKLSEHLVADGVEVHVLTRGGGAAAGRGGAPRRGRAPRARAAVPEGHGRVPALGQGHERRHARARVRAVRAARTSTSSTRTTGSWRAPRARSLAAPACRGWSPCTPPSTAATRAGCRTIRSRTSTRSSARWCAAPITSSPARSTCRATCSECSARLRSDSPRSPTGSTRRTWSRPRRRISPPSAPGSPGRSDRLVLLVGRLVYEKGFHLALDALAPVVRRLGNVRFVVAGHGHGRGGAQAPGAPVAPDALRVVPRLGGRRPAPRALPRGRPLHRALDLRAVRAGRARGDGVGLPVRRRRHRRPARGGARRRHGRAALPRPRRRRPAGDPRASPGR